MVTSSTTNKPKVIKNVARGGKMVINTGPVRDSANEVGKAPREMGGSRDDLSHSITDGNKVPSY